VYYFLSVVIILVILSITYEGLSPWYDWEQHPNPWCERDRETSLFREPANSWSDLVYFSLSLFILYCAIWDIQRSEHSINSKKNLLIRLPGLSVIFAIANFMHFLGTFMNHACRCEVGHILDCGGMYFITSAPSLYSLYVYNTQPSLPLNCWSGVLGYLSCGFLFYVYAAKFPGDLYRDMLMVSLLISTIFGIYFLLKRGHVLNTKLIMYSFLLFIFGYIAWLLDTFHIICFPDSIFQLHAVWHVVTAVALGMTYLTFRAENNLDLNSAIQ